jgi:hypothetical protein
MDCQVVSMSEGVGLVVSIGREPEPFVVVPARATWAMRKIGSSFTMRVGPATAVCFVAASDEPVDTVRAR